MVQSTAFSPVSQSAKPRSDWYTILRSAFINGLKAYGASLMMVVPPDTTEAQANIASSTPLTRNNPVAGLRPKTAVDIRALPQTSLAKPAWKHA